MTQQKIFPVCPLHGEKLIEITWVQASWMSSGIGKYVDFLHYFKCESGCPLGTWLYNIRNNMLSFYEGLKAPVLYPSRFKDKVKGGKHG